MFYTFCNQFFDFDKAKLTILENNNMAHCETNIAIHEMNRRTDNQNKFIGVSKSCCSLCSTILDILGFDYSEKDANMGACRKWKVPSSMNTLDKKQISAFSCKVKELLEMTTNIEPIENRNINTRIHLDLSLIHI